MDHISYIDMILEIQEESFHSLDPFTLTIDNIEYTILKSNKDTILLGESNNTLYSFQQIPCAPELISSKREELKQLESIIPVVCGVKKTVHILDGTIIIKTEHSRIISVYDFLKYKSDSRIPAAIKSNTFLCVDIILRSLQALISNIAAAERNQVQIPNISLENIYIEISPTPQHPIFIENSVGIDIKIDVIGNNPLEVSYVEPLYGLALCLFSILRGKPYKSLDFYLNSDYKKNKEKILRIYPYALCNMIESLIQPGANAQEILFSPMVSTWIYLLKEYENIPSSHCFNSDALLAGVFLKKKSNRVKAALILISQEKNNLIEFLESRPAKTQNYRRIARCLCRYSHWNQIDESLLRTSISLLRALLSKNPELLARPGPWKINKALSFPIQDLELISLICNNFTKTAANIAFRNSANFSQIASTECYYLTILPDASLQRLQYLKTLADCRTLSAEGILKALHATPITIRRLHQDLTYSIIKQCFSSQHKIPYDSFKTALQVLREAVYEGKKAQDCNIHGKCYKNEEEWNSTALIMYCINCSVHLCLVCGSNHRANDHQIRYLRGSTKCEKPAAADQEGMVKNLFDIREISMSFFDSRGNMSEDTIFSSGDFKGEISVTSLSEITVIYSDDRHSTLLYYEVMVLDAGCSENISIGIDGTGVLYSGNTGEITGSRGKVKTVAPRFGTGDVVGIGFTSTHFLYFTFNGYNLHLYKQCEVGSEIRPLVKMKGRGIQIKILTKDFLFLGKTYTNKLSLQDSAIKTEVTKWCERLDITDQSQSALQKCIEGTDLDFKLKITSKRHTHRHRKLKDCKKACMII